MMCFSKKIPIVEILLIRTESLVHNRPDTSRSKSSMMKRMPASAQRPAEKCLISWNHLTHSSTVVIYDNAETYDDHTDVFLFG